MSAKIPIVLKLLDFGWIAADTLDLPKSDSTTTAIIAYRDSPAFHTSFLPSDKDETGIHGPFAVDKIEPSDFVAFTKEELERNLESIAIARLEKDDVLVRANVQDFLLPRFQESNDCFLLKHDERSEDRLHDWGFVFFLFREFLFIKPDGRQIERVVLGYD